MKTCVLKADERPRVHPSHLTNQCSLRLVCNVLAQRRAFRGIPRAGQLSLARELNALSGEDKERREPSVRHFAW